MGSSSAACSAERDAGEDGHFRIRLHDWGGDDPLDWAIIAGNFTPAPEPALALLQTTVVVLMVLARRRSRVLASRRCAGY
jgi:hypothetical protein